MKNMTGTVVKVFGRYYTIEVEGERFNAVLRGRLKLDEELRRFASPLAVGDLVDYTRGPDGGISIDRIHPRTNFFSRKDRGTTRIDLIAANLDQILVIQSFAEPVLNLRFVDRLLVRGIREGIPVCLCVNKADLAIKEDIRFIKDYYRLSGLDIIIASAETGKGIEQLRKRVAGNRTILAGYSGVGKTSLLNCLYPGLKLKTGEVSDSTGKGRHTTTNVEMVRLKDGTELIDTPGMREFGLMDIRPEELAGLFPDFTPFAGSCQFRPCTHDHEPRCEVKRRVEAGEISEERYISYLNILYSLREYYQNLY